MAVYLGCVLEMSLRREGCANEFLIVGNKEKFGFYVNMSAVLTEKKKWIAETVMLEWVGVCC